MIVLRWIAMLPGATLGALLAYWAIKFGNRVSMSMIGINPDGLISSTGIELMSSGVMGAAFVFVAAKLAPFHKTQVAFIFAGLGILLSGMMLFASAIGTSWLAVLSCVAMAIGSGAVAYMLFTGEIDEESLMMANDKVVD